MPQPYCESVVDEYDYSATSTSLTKSRTGPPPLRPHYKHTASVHSDSGYSSKTGLTSRSAGSRQSSGKTAKHPHPPATAGPLATYHSASGLPANATPSQPPAGMPAASASAAAAAIPRPASAQPQDLRYTVPALDRRQPPPALPPLTTAPSYTYSSPPAQSPYPPPHPTYPVPQHAPPTSWAYPPPPQQQQLPPSHQPRPQLSMMHRPRPTSISVPPHGYAPPPGPPSAGYTPVRSSPSYAPAPSPYSPGPSPSGHWEWRGPTPAPRPRAQSRASDHRRHSIYGQPAVLQQEDARQWDREAMPPPPASSSRRRSSSTARPPAQTLEMPYRPPPATAAKRPAGDRKTQSASYTRGEVTQDVPGKSRSRRQHSDTTVPQAAARKMDKTARVAEDYINAQSQKTSLQLTNEELAKRSLDVKSSTSKSQKSSRSAAVSEGGTRINLGRDGDMSINSDANVEISYGEDGKPRTVIVSGGKSGASKRYFSEGSAKSKASFAARASRKRDSVVDAGDPDAAVVGGGAIVRTSSGES